MYKQIYVFNCYMNAAVNNSLKHNVHSNNDNTNMVAYKINLISNKHFM